MRRSIIILILLLIPQVSFGETTAPLTEENWPSGGPYCGVASVFAALQANGIYPKFGDLLVTKYIGSTEGSSLSELVDAVRDSGGHGTPFHGLSAAGLKALRYPAILHVAGASKPRQYNHWLVYLGSENGMARVLDPPHAVEQVSYSDLLSQWDGVAIVVSNRPLNTAAIRLAEGLAISVKVLMACGVIGLAVATAGSSRRAYGPVVILFMVCVLAVVVDVAGGSRVISNRWAVASITSAYVSRSFPEITLSQLQKTIENREATVIDARDAGSFNLGHIVESVSLPIDSSLGRRRQVMSTLNAARPVVVYCQSTECPYSDIVATELALNGYVVSIYRPGWQEWKSTLTKK